MSFVAQIKKTYGLNGSEILYAVRVCGVCLLVSPHRLLPCVGTNLESSTLEAGRDRSDFQVLHSDEKQAQARRRREKQIWVFAKYLTHSPNLRWGSMLKMDVCSL